MIKVIGVRFRTAGKIYFFDPADFDIKKGDHVIVETARGIEFGTVVGGIRQVADDEIIQPLKPVLRIATERDVCQEADNKRREKEAYKLCLEKIREHGLDMKLIDAEYTFDNNKVLFYFTSDGRIDFRELVKDLAAIFKTRIELRQIGVRDETKMVGGIGMCGRPLCCHTHLSDFVPVSIKMAKEQNLSLNPTKISGVCGRLMCCLNHEEETYEELNRNLPHVGDKVTCPDGTQGEVVSVNVLRQIVKVVVENGDSKEICDYKAEDIRFVRKGHRQIKPDVSAEELRALELMEKQDKIENKDEESKPVGSQKKERGERLEKSERKNRGDRMEREERLNRNERSNKEERVSREEREERRERRNREERRERRRGDRRERENAEMKNTEHSENAKAEVNVNTSAEVEPAESTKEGSVEKKNRYDKKRRYDRKDRNRDQAVQSAGEESAVKAENVQRSKDTAKSDSVQGLEEKKGGEHTEHNRKKGYYNRNRRRNRPEGAKEQHES